MSQANSVGTARFRAIGAPFGFACACLALLTISWRENVKIRALDPGRLESPPEDSVRWNPVLAKVLSFGQVPAVVDWMWLRLLQDPNIAHVKKGQHPAGYYDTLLATELDPAYFEIYMIGADILSIIRDDNDGALELVRRAQEFAKSGLPALGPKFADRYWNPAWAVPMARAYLDLFEFGNLPSAAVAFTEASKMPGSPVYLKHLAARLSSVAGQYEVATSLLQFKLESATAKDASGEAREGLERKIRDLRVGRFLFQINERFGEYLGKHKHSKDLSRAFGDFLAETGETGVDPFGSQLKVGDKGRIITTTPYENVFKMEQ